MLKSRIETSLIFLFTLLTISACGGTIQSSASKSGSNEARTSSPKVTLDFDVLSEQGTPALIVDDKSMTSSPFQKSSLRQKTILRKASRLVAIVDTECAEANPGGLSQEIQESTNNKRILKSQAYSFALNQDTSLDSLLLESMSDPCITQIVNDGDVKTGAVPNDPLYSQQWHHTNIQSATGWDSFYGAGGITSDVVIAIIDTGVDYLHPDLAPNILRSTSGITGYDFVSDDSDPMDENGHGTHCAGLAAAVVNNSVGIAGVMGSGLKIMPVKTLAAGGTGTIANVINGINFAVEKKADVISLSWGVRGTNTAVKAAIQNAVLSGVTVFAAAGNNGIQLTARDQFAPASYGIEIQGMVTVGATMPSNSRAAFSNWGDRYVEMGAPGFNILSTGLDGTYFSQSGTSMSTPLSAGAGALIIGLLRSRGVTPTPALVEELLINGSAHDPLLAQFFRLGTRLDLASLATQLDILYPPVLAPPTIKTVADTANIGTPVTAGMVLINNVLANDTIGGVRASIANVKLSGVKASPWLKLNVATGQILASRRLLPGNYLYTYRVCQKEKPANCKIERAVVRVFR